MRKAQLGMLKGGRRRKTRITESIELNPQQVLERFLAYHNLSHLRNILEELGIDEMDKLLGDGFEIAKCDPRISKDDCELLMQARCASQRDVRRLSRRCDHVIFLSHYKFEAGTEAALMQKDLEHLIVADPDCHFGSGQHHVFLDSEDLQDLAELRTQVQRSYNLVVLLTPHVLTRPWVLVEIVTAIHSNVRVVPVEIQRKGSTFIFPDDEYYERLRQGTQLQESARKLLAEQNITLPDLAECLQQVFLRIAVPFSPHRPASIRQAELKDILRHCTKQNEQLTFML